MTIEEAEKILGVEANDDERMLKMRFRKLMRIHHPDVISSNHPDYTNKAQQINEAYTLLQKQIPAQKKSSTPSPAWKDASIPEAFRERTIYMSEHIFDEHQASYIPVITGKYPWNPDLEEFQCLLYSLNQTAAAILREIELSHTPLEGAVQGDFRFPYQLQLFHLLARQYIQPLFCLKKLAGSPSTDDAGRFIYAVNTLLTVHENSSPQAVTGLKQGDSVFVDAIINNRIRVSNGGGNSLGYLSFPDDSLYYVIIPILQNRSGQVKCIVKDISPTKNGLLSKRKINITLYLRIDPNLQDKNPAHLNAAIDKVIKDYETALSS